MGQSHGSVSGSGYVLGSGTCPVCGVSLGRVSLYRAMPLKYLFGGLPYGYLKEGLKRGRGQGAVHICTCAGGPMEAKASVKFSCVTVDILLVLSYARNPRNLLRHFDSYSFAWVFLLLLLMLQWLITNEAIKWLLYSAALPSATRLACQMCQNSSVRLIPSAFATSQICMSAACAGLAHSLPAPTSFLHHFHSHSICLPHLSLVFL